MRNPKTVSLSVRTAQWRTRAVIKQVRTTEIAWVRLGRMIDKCLRDNVPASLEMNAATWIEHVCNEGGSSVQKGWRALRITRAFSSLSEKKIAQIPETNAYEMTHLPEKQRTSKEWLDKAQTLTKTRFKEEVDSALEKKGIQRQEFITLRASMPRAVYEKFEQAIQKMAKVCGIDILESEGRRIMVYERIADLVLGINEDTLKTAVEGGE